MQGMWPRTCRQELYRAADCKFIYVGPLLDKAGAKRAAGHKFDASEMAEEPVACSSLG